MKWTLAFGALACLASLEACGGDVGAPGPNGTSSGASSVVDAGGTGTGTEKLGYGAVGCKEGTDCESGLCFEGRQQQFCTVKCTAENAPQVCSAPFTGTCNKQGFCKRD